MIVRDIMVLTDLNLKMILFVLLVENLIEWGQSNRYKIPKNIGDRGLVLVVLSPLFFLGPIVIFWLLCSYCEYAKNERSLRQYWCTPFIMSLISLAIYVIVIIVIVVTVAHPSGNVIYTVDTYYASSDCSGTPIFIQTTNTSMSGCLGASCTTNFRKTTYSGTTSCITTNSPAIPKGSAVLTQYTTINCSSSSIYSISQFLGCSSGFGMGNGAPETYTCSNGAINYSIFSSSSSNCQGSPIRIQSITLGQCVYSTPNPFFLWWTYSC